MPLTTTGRFGEFIAYSQEYAQYINGNMYIRSFMEGPQPAFASHDEEQFATNSFIHDNGRKKPRYDIFCMPDGDERLIDSLTVDELQTIVGYADKGYKCYGQLAKIYTLRRLLEEKNATVHTPGE